MSSFNLLLLFDLEPPPTLHIYIVIKGIRKKKCIIISENHMLKKKKKGICEALSIYPISLHLIIKRGIKVATLSCPCCVFVLILS